MSHRFSTSIYHPEINYVDLLGIPMIDNDANVIDHKVVTRNDFIFLFARRSYDGVFEYPTYEEAVEFHVPASAPSIHPPGYWEEYQANYWADPRIWELIDTPENGLVYIVKH